MARNTRWISRDSFHKIIRLWPRLKEIRGPDILKHCNNINWTPEQNIKIVSKLLAENSIRSVEIGVGINPGQLHTWLRKYKIYEYNGLGNKKRCRKSGKESMNQKDKLKLKELNKSEKEILIRLRAENEYIKAKNGIIKKRNRLERKELHCIIQS